MDLIEVGLKNTEIAHPNKVQVLKLSLFLLIWLYIMVAGGVGCAVAAAVGAIGDIILWSDPEQERRLDTEEHTGEEKQSKAELPGADPSSQDQL